MPSSLLRTGINALRDRYGAALSVGSSEGAGVTSDDLVLGTRKWSSLLRAVAPQSLSDLRRLFFFAAACLLLFVLGMSCLRPS